MGALKKAIPSPTRRSPKIKINNMPDLYALISKYYHKNNENENSSPLRVRGVGGVKFIGIDGLGAAGKTTLAQKIAKQLGNATIIHTDDFYKPLAERTVGLVPEIISPDFDWDRLEREVFIAPQPPLIGKRGSKGEIVIVVGVYALQKRFLPYYDFTIWVEAPRELRIKRMIEREGAAVAQEWQKKWMAREERYAETERPFDAASTIFENTSG